MLRPGDYVYVCVTDHPSFPATTHEGDPGYFADESSAARIADAWNSYYAGQANPWPWRVEKRKLLESRLPTRSGDQLGMFDR